MIVIGRYPFYLESGKRTQSDGVGLSRQLRVPSQTDKRGSVGGSTVSQTEDRFKETSLTLKDLGFDPLELSLPDPEHFGNWILIAGRDNLVVRLIGDRGHVNVDMTPVFLFEAGAPESEWFTWDVVASTLGIPLEPETDAWTLLQGHRDDVNRLCAPENWTVTRKLLAYAEKEKRRRFTEGRKVAAHA
jgi:hypothetical protein